MTLMRQGGSRGAKATESDNRRPAAGFGSIRKTERSVTHSPFAVNRDGGAGAGFFWVRLRDASSSSKVHAQVKRSILQSIRGLLGLQSHNPAIGFCTLAIQAPYRRRARLLCGDVTTLPWTVLTDVPEDFSDLPVTVIAHAPTGPMASDYLRTEYLTRQQPAGARGAAAYHDKRFALLATLKGHRTAIYFDADSRVGALPLLGAIPTGLCALPVVQNSIAGHLERWGSWRIEPFTELALHLTGDAGILTQARWCHESLLAVTADGREKRFFQVWAEAAAFLQAREVYSGEGGVIGIAAACAGWTVNFEALHELGAVVRHEGGGPKAS